MIPELGHFALWLAAAATLLQALAPSIGLWRRDDSLQRLAVPAAMAQARALVAHAAMRPLQRPRHLPVHATPWSKSWQACTQRSLVTSLCRSSAVSSRI